MTGLDVQSEQAWEQLLASAQTGDAAAYRAFLAAILPFARSVARRRAWNDDTVEDIVQESLLTIHRVRHTYEPGRPVRPWVAAIVVRRAIDHGRRSGRISARETHDPHAYETFADDAANQETDQANMAREAAGLLEELTPKQREAIELTKLNEMSLAEASAASGQSIASLKVNVHRAMRRLRAGLSGADRREP